MSELEQLTRNILVGVMEEQVANPARAVVNGESSFVRSELYQLKSQSLAKRYWNWVCQFTGTDKDRKEFGDEVFNLQLKLNEIDSCVKMPSWGTIGT